MLSIGFLGRAALACALLLGMAGTASAIQFALPSADTRLHTLTSLQPGAEWNTGSLGAAGGEVSYSSVTEQLTLDAGLDVLNYFDPNVGACPTDAGSNCAHNFTTNLDLSVAADLVSITVTAQGFGFFNVTADFETTGGTDITLVDPTDSNVLLTAEWQAGTFNNSPTTGLSVSATYNLGNVFGNTGFTGDPTAVGFAEITGGTYAQLFDSGGSSDISLHLAEFFDFTPTLDTIGAAIIANFVASGGTGVNNGALLSFTAEGEGQIFRVAAGDFVPEPGTAVLLGTGVLALLAGSRRWMKR